MIRTNDKDIRTAVKKQLQHLTSANPHTILLEEFSVRHGLARVDLLVVNKHLHAIELKSDSDSLGRLPDQIRQYSSVFDKVTLVVGYRLAHEALKLVPQWWGVKLAHRDEKGRVLISSARTARKNPSQSPLALVSILWRNEALLLLSEADLSQGYRSKSRAHIYQKVVESLDVDTIRCFVIERLRARTESPIAAPQTLCGD